MEQFIEDARKDKVVLECICEYGWIDTDSTGGALSRCTSSQIALLLLFVPYIVLFHPQFLSSW